MATLITAVTLITAARIMAVTLILGDLHAYDPARRRWTDLSAPAAGVPAPARLGHGFAAAGGRLFVSCGCTQAGCIGGPADAFRDLVGNAHSQRVSYARSRY